MAFNDKVKFEILDAFGVDLDAAPGDKFTWTILHPMLIHRVEVIYTEATPASLTTPGAVALDHTPSGGLRAEKATYTAETSKAVGSVGVLKDANGNENISLFVAKGDTIHFEHTTQQDSLTTGAVIFIVFYELIPDATV